MSGLKLFRTDTTNSGMTEVIARLAEIEADVQGLVEAHMETLLGVRFLVSEYSTGPVHGGRIDSLGLDENGSPVIVEYKRGTDAGVINQGLFYLAWLMDHRAEFEHLVRDRLGVTAASQVLWSGPRLICIAGDFTRYDVHAVREHRRSIDQCREVKGPMTMSRRSQDVAGPLLSRGSTKIFLREQRPCGPVCHGRHQ